MKYKVTICEILEREVYISSEDAENEKQAISKVRELYNNKEINLTNNDLAETTFTCGRNIFRC